MKNKKIIFLTGTRADFGKQKSLIESVYGHKDFEVYIFVTGMHLEKEYGYTFEEVKSNFPKNIIAFKNSKKNNSMDEILANTILGFTKVVKEIIPDFVVVHGDRVEALAGAIVGALNNIRTLHIEGGERSGTIDESIRHSISKLSHIHLVANNEAMHRLRLLGEDEKSIFIIGSPDIDIMRSDKLPNFEKVLKHYEIPFKDYGILLFHPVTTNSKDLPKSVKNLVDSIIDSKKRFIVILPNNDLGTEIIQSEYKRFTKNENIKVFPSIRFEYFLSLLKNSQFIIGNSSAGIREAPFYGIPTINIGDRQSNRAEGESILNIDFSKKQILEAINNSLTKKFNRTRDFGDGTSDNRFLKLLEGDDFSNIKIQKNFIDFVSMNTL